MNRSRAYYRHHRERVINRKKDICKRLGGDEFLFGWTRGELGRLSKGKIHCSCGMCRRKSYDEVKHSEKRKM